MNRYDHKSIEKKWQDAWEESGVHTTPDATDKENFYMLVEFPYPSGNLHVGHWYAFAVSDIYARFMRTQNKNVLFPIGFDAFGLPAENAAIKHGLDPREWTEKNMAHMEGQLKSMGATFDWTRKLATCDPTYYKWTQWIFTQFFENGLAYQAEAPVNWCESCKTILANEQVVNGACERCGNEVIEKQMKQWMLRITDFAEDLLSGLDNLSWPEEIKASQRNWIGKSEGAEIDFKIVGKEESITVFTTRADTVFSGTFVILAPEHPLIEKLSEDIQNIEEVREYQKQAQKKDSIERTDKNNKSGVELKGVSVVNPATGKELPVWVSDFVLGGYGTGAVFADAHDERDFDMAKQYGIPLAVSIIPENEDVADKVKNLKECFSGEGVLINSEQFDGLTSFEARPKIVEWLKEKGLAKPAVKYRLRDWSVSRQRYWGCPIPVVYDPEGKPHVVPKEHLPWTLPGDVDPTPTGVPPLAKSEELKKRTVEIFGEGWTPEVETFDTFIDSSWYFLRYLDSKNEEHFAGSEKVDAWMPVDFYSGGAEHNTMHLLYSRFFVKVLNKLGFVDITEPFAGRLNRALILGPDGNKMSKSKGNVIDPDEIVERLGADTVRLYLAFIGPYNEVGSYPWDPNGIVGMRRFIERVWRMHEQVKDGVEDSKEVLHALHKTIKKVTEDFGVLKFNTAIAQVMTLANVVDKSEISKETYQTVLQLLAPIIPHATEELWELSGGEGSVHGRSFPTWDEKYLVSDTMTLSVQVNGKLRATFEADADISEEEAKKTAQELPNVRKWTGGSEVVKVIYVPKRLVSIVVKG